jgi:hypothetical protein
LQDLYRTLGAENAVELHPLLQFGHNYNSPSRAALCAFFNQHLRLGRSAEQLQERDYARLDRADLTVWNAEFPRPEGDQAGPVFEKNLLRRWAEDTTARLREHPGAAESGWRVILGPTPEPEPDAFAYAGALEKFDRRDWIELRAVIRHRTSGEEVAATFLHPTRWNGRTVIWLDGRDAPGEEAERLARNGVAVVLSRLHRPDLRENPRVPNPRMAAAFTYGYNPTLFARRVQDAVALVRFCRTRADYPVKRLDLVGLDGFGPHAAAARLLCGADVSSTRHDAAAFRWMALGDWRHADFLPGAARYGDLPGLLAQPGSPVTAVEGAEEACAQLLAE